MKSAIISILGNVGSTLNSQGGAYGLICTKMVKDYNQLDSLDVNPNPDTWSQYDMLYVCEGVNFAGSFNIPGGVQQQHIDKVVAMSQYRGQIQFVNKVFDFDMFNTKRIKLTDAQFPTGEMVDYFTETAKKTRKIVIGDSHSLSVWKPGYGLSFNQGKTLFGWLKTANQSLMNELYDEVILYFGNIDIRFHLYRQNDPIKATEELFNRYVEFAKGLNNCTIVQPLTIEHESRKIPGSGLYKGKPFYGSRYERMAIRDTADRIMRNSGLNYITWPDEWIDEEGTKMLDILEQKQSVHLRPKYFPNINDLLS